MTLFDLVRLSVNVAVMVVGSRGASSPKVYMAGVRRQLQCWIAGVRTASVLDCSLTSLVVFFSGLKSAV